MDIYITNLTNNERLRLPMLPEEIKGKLGNKFASYNVIGSGDVKMPSGTTLDTYSWSATFPGKRRKKAPYVTKWKAPKKCDKFMRALKAGDGKINRVKARLMITGTRINLDVYLQDYSPVESGGYGDISYSVTFIRAKDLTVDNSAKAETDKKTGSANSAGSSGSSGSGNGSGNGKGTAGANSSTTVKKPPEAKPEARTSPPASGTYTVKSGDSLWGIAQKFYKNGAKYTVIRDANKALIAKHNGGPNMIYPGDVLKIP